MSVRKRKWTTKGGEEREAWIVQYIDQDGVDRIKTFARKNDADAFENQTGVDISKGTHVADSKSVTVNEAGRLWLESVTGAGLERTTIEQYRQHLNHMAPYIGHSKLSQLNAPIIRTFEDRLRANGRSPVMVNYVVRSLGALLADAQERGLVVRNAVRELSRHRGKGKDRQNERHNGKLKVGIDIPTNDEIKRILAAAEGRWRPFLHTAVFTGLRGSELRGLRWIDVDLSKAELHVRQRADRYAKIGPPKSKAGERTIPLPPDLVKMLREWKLACPIGELGLVFPNGAGKPEFHTNVLQRGFQPTLLAAGVTTKTDGALQPKYTGLHSLRHWFASWCINRRADGGRELPAKNVQGLLGHSSIVVTLDTYGHLYPRGDDAAELAAAARGLLT
jgi:integrase